MKVLGSRWADAWSSIPAKDLVPDDILEIEAGDNIPADTRLLKAFSLSVQEAALTVESIPVDKDADVTLDESTTLGDRINMIYMGTMVASGKGLATVVATGMNTKWGSLPECFTHMR